MRACFPESILKKSLVLLLLSSSLGLALAQTPAPQSVPPAVAGRTITEPAPAASAKKKPQHHAAAKSAKSGKKTTAAKKARKNAAGKHAHAAAKSTHVAKAGGKPGVKAKAHKRHVTA